MRFEFATATRILFGPGAVREVGPLAAAMSPAGRPRRALVVCGRSSERARPLIDVLEPHGLEAVMFSVSGEPDIDGIERGVSQARERECSVVIGFGGGSAMDAGKAIAVMLTNPGELLDYLEMVGHGRPLVEPPSPFIAIPTTAGTGAEVTRNAVLASPAHQVKVSMRSPLMLPRLAVVDPELTYSLPPELTASTGMDALTQLIEAFVSLRANPLTDAVCREGIVRAARSLEKAVNDGLDPIAREDMALASLCGGLALANAGLGAVHGFAGPIGGMFSAPHGAVCAALLPNVAIANLWCLRERPADAAARAKFEELGGLLTGQADAGANDGVLWLGQLCRRLSIPPLSAYGLRKEHVPALVEKAQSASSMKTNPVFLTTDELKDILAAAL